MDGSAASKLIIASALGRCSDDEDDEDDGVRSDEEHASQVGVRAWDTEDPVDKKLIGPAPRVAPWVRKSLVLFSNQHMPNWCLVFLAGISRY
jgi:hypothetical protein